MKQLTKKWATWALLGGAALLSAPALADQLADMATRLSNLRADVETLSSELAAETTDGRDQLRPLSRQKSELELEIKKEQTRTAKIRQVINERRRDVQAAKKEDGEMAPLFEKNFLAVREQVAQSLPFHTADRLAELDKIMEQYKAGLVSAPKGVGRLWSFMEDEFRLTRENGLYQQTVMVNGQPQLAEVVRIGMVMLFFKAGDRTLGKAVNTDGKWSYELIEDKDQQKQVLSLFVSFKKQIRQGFFTLPNALPELVGAAQ